jgi:3-deoxy-7-phosphoheptulonate synthase
VNRGLSCEWWDESEALAALRLVRRRSPEHSTVVRAGAADIGGDCFAVAAGPCAVETERQIMATAEAVAGAGAKLLRGGCFKPRTSPYSFQGRGVEGLKLIRKAGDAFGLPVVTDEKSERRRDEPIDIFLLPAAVLRL